MLWYKIMQIIANVNTFVKKCTYYSLFVTLKFTLNEGASFSHQTLQLQNTSTYLTILTMDILFNCYSLQYYIYKFITFYYKPICNWDWKR